MESRHRVPTCPCPENSPYRQKTQLAVAIAQGEAVASWANRNGVPERTAYRWAREPKVRAMVETIRRTRPRSGRRSDDASGHLRREAIVNLGKSASSESVRLAALGPSCQT